MHSLTQGTVRHTLIVTQLPRGHRRDHRCPGTPHTRSSSHYVSNRNTVATCPSVVTVIVVATAGRSSCLAPTADASTALSSGLKMSRPCQTGQRGGYRCPLPSTIASTPPPKLSSIDDPSS